MEFFRKLPNFKEKFTEFLREFVGKVPGNFLLGSRQSFIRFYLQLKLQINELFLWGGGLKCNSKF